MSVINLFCLPFAGGSKSSYHAFTRLTPDCLRIVPVELPGRGARFREPLLTELHAMVQDILLQIRPQLHQPYAVFGHSMGALLGYLLAKQIEQEHISRPMHLFLTGCGAPSMPDRKNPLHRMSKPDFIDALRVMGGMPDEILQEDKLLDLFLPIIRADFHATETFEYAASRPLDVPMTIITGTEEHISPDRIAGWKNETTAPISFRQLPGNHFFIFNYPTELMELMAGTLIPATRIAG